MPIETVTAVWDAEKNALVPVSKQTYSKWVASQPFAMLPHPTHPLLFTITHVKDFHVLFGLCEMAEFNTNKIFIHSSRRKELMGRVSMSSQHLANSLKRLREAGIISGGKGEVIINPQVAWRGTSAARQEAIRAMMPETLATVKSTFESDGVPN